MFSFWWDSAVIVLILNCMKRQVWGSSALQTSPCTTGELAAALFCTPSTNWWTSRLCVSVPLRMTLSWNNFALQTLQRIRCLQKTSANLTVSAGSDCQSFTDTTAVTSSLFCEELQLSHTHPHTFHVIRGHVCNPVPLKKSKFFKNSVFDWVGQWNHFSISVNQRMFHMMTLQR